MQGLQRQRPRRFAGTRQRQGFGRARTVRPRPDPFRPTYAPRARAAGLSGPPEALLQRLGQARRLRPYNEIFRKEDGEQRVLFSFQETGTFLSLGLNIGGYLECRRQDRSARSGPLWPSGITAPPRSMATWVFRWPPHWQTQSSRHPYCGRSRPRLHRLGQRHGVFPGRIG